MIMSVLETTIFVEARIHLTLVVIKIVWIITGFVNPQPNVAMAFIVMMIDVNYGLLMEIPVMLAKVAFQAIAKFNLAHEQVRVNVERIVIVNPINTVFEITMVIPNAWTKKNKLTSVILMKRVSQKGALRQLMTRNVVVFACNLANVLVISGVVGMEKIKMNVLMY